MKSIISYIKSYFIEGFWWPAWAVTLPLLAFAIYANYEYGLKEMVLTAHVDSPYYFFYCAVWYGVPYTVPLVLELFNPKTRPNFRKAIPVLLLGLFTISINEAFVWHRDWLLQILDANLYWYFRKLSNQVVQCLTFFLPCIAYYFIAERNSTSLYGFAKCSLSLKPYWIMLGIMAVPVLVASFTEGFMSAYPIFNDYGAGAEMGVPQWKLAVLFEFFYGLDFISVEFFFRGFMVLALVRTLGYSALLPIATLYCTYHFGKPAGEAVSSFFGGMLLGLISFRTGSIYGGIIIHLGIAWMMELFAFLQK